jgi:hypothetical protein
MITRIHHLRNTLQTNWTADPAARGAAKVAAGAVLVVEGLFGPARAARAWASGNPRSAGGLGAGLVGVAVGLLLLIVPGLLDDTPDGVLVEVPGVVSDVFETRDSDGERLYGAVYTYEAEGRSHDIRSSSRSSTRPAIGSEVTIAYPEADPAAGRRVDGIEGRWPLILRGVGAVVLLFALVSLTISVVLIVVGVKLFRQGRRERTAAGASRGVVAELFELVRTTDRRMLDVAATAAGVPGPAAAARAVGERPPREGTEGTATR